MSEQRPDFMERVAEFNRQAQLPPPGDNFNANRVTFYTGCQFEELAEKIEVIAGGAVDLQERDMLQKMYDVLKDASVLFKSGKFTGCVMRANREDLLSEEIDVAVVTAGSLCYQTPHFLDAAHALCDANDQKWINGVKRDPATGKVLKPEGFKPADLSKFVVRSDD